MISSPTIMGILMDMNDADIRGIMYPHPTIAVCMAVRVKHRDIEQAQMIIERHRPAGLAVRYYALLPVEKMFSRRFIVMS